MMGVRSEDQRRVVIVGGGIAGIALATRLGRASRRLPGLHVTLVDKYVSHVWKPALHTVAAGTSRPDQQRLSFFDQAKHNGFKFWPGRFDGVDRNARTIRVASFVDAPSRDGAPDRDLPYDVLVLCLGSRANDFGTPGVAENCISIDDVMEAEDFHGRLCRHLLARMGRREALDIAIIGGGATGVELAAELKRAIDSVASYRPGEGGGDCRLTLIEAGPRLLGAFPGRVSDAVARTLVDLGITVRTGATVREAKPDAFVLQDGERIEAGIKVWAAGIKAPDVLGAIDGLERSKSGQLLVTDRLQTTRDAAIFALGDCSSVASRPVPATAQAARQQALYLSRLLPAIMRGEPASPFRYRNRGSIVSLSDYNGWGTLGHYTIGGGWLRGLTARLAHSLLFRQHQLELLGLARGTLRWVADDIAGASQPLVRLD